ncbi:protein kinase-like domain, concanavalin A-like lectin/glucanase domain protein [Tanacetum coccineum]
MENANPSSTLESLSQESLDTTHAKFTAQINKLLAMRQTIDSLLFKTINEMTDQSSDSEIFCPEVRNKELELRIQQRNNFEEGLFKNMFPTEEELVYHKELGRDRCTIDIKWKERQQNPSIFKLQMMVGYHVGNFFLPQIDSGADYVISFTTDDISEESSTYIGKSKFLGTKFTVYDSYAGTYRVSRLQPFCSTKVLRSMPLMSMDTSIEQCRVFTKLTRLHQNLSEDWISRGIEDAKE